MDPSAEPGRTRTAPLQQASTKDWKCRGHGCRVRHGTRGPCMSAIEQLWSRRIAIGWTVTIAAAFAVYFSGISHEAIWYDESISIAIANRTFAGILRFMPNENHPPLHFLLLHFARLLFGNSEWAMRLPSALGAVGL